MIRCKKVVIRIENCKEEKILDYLILIQESDKKHGTLLLDVIGVETLRINMESLILEVIGKDFIRICVKPARTN